MSHGLPAEFKELVRSRTDLVDLVGESVALTATRGGSDYIGLCPFHDDHNPSFHVYPERQSYRCWVCDEGGDCFSFVMKREAVSFVEALELLARRANVELPRRPARARSRSGPDKPRLFEALNWARGEFHRCLCRDDVAGPVRDYLQQRGVTSEMIERFQLGYHPPQWEWLLQRSGHRFPESVLLAARLIAERSRGEGYRDNFVDRLMFPIHDTQGRCVAFGGRILPGRDREQEPKYWNSPESELFSKKQLLYGLDVARDAIRRSGVAVVMEGYTDCIAAHQHGVPNTVSTLGTALSEEHVGTLKRFARTVVLVFDGDQAGQNAAERSLTKFLAQKLDLRLLTLPGGLDPAEFLAEHGGAAFQEWIDQASEVWEYKFQSIVRRFGTETIDARHRVLDAMLGEVSQVPKLAASEREDLLLGRLAQRLGLSEAVVRQRLAQQRRQARRAPSAPHPGAADSPRPVLETLPSEIPSPNPVDSGRHTTKNAKYELQERELLEIIFSAPETASAIQSGIGCDEIHHPQLRTLLQVCFDLLEQGVEPTFRRVMDELEDPTLKRLAVQLDEMSRQKQIARKLTEDAQYVTTAMHTLQWRREELSHEQIKGQLAAHNPAPDAEGGLGEEARALLQSASEFNRKRATRQHPRTHLN